MRFALDSIWHMFFFRFVRPVRIPKPAAPATHPHGDHCTSFFRRLCVYSVWVCVCAFDIFAFIFVWQVFCGSLGPLYGMSGPLWQTAGLFHTFIENFCQLSGDVAARAMYSVVSSMCFFPTFGAEVCAIFKAEMQFSVQLHLSSSAARPSARPPAWHLGGLPTLPNRISNAELAASDNDMQRQRQRQQPSPKKADDNVEHGKLGMVVGGDRGGKCRH